MVYFFIFFVYEKFFYKKINEYDILEHIFSKDSMFAYQLDFFEPEPTDLDIMHAEIKSMKQSQDNMRKGLFARYNKMYKEMQDQLNDMNAEILRLKLLVKNI